ncbi:MAG: hypothetical protein B6I37_04955 [Desulfobacteraceae bacterium 4572_35.2]|nr:MAG: hypothetical protein B6I37_04955 [Desulfobacteraceae bacterium 4572_35.2]
MLPKYKTILLAIDLSENSAYALRHAVAIGRCHNAKVHLLHVLPDVEPAVLNYVATVMGEGRLADYELQHKEDVRDKVRVSVHEFAKSELLNNPEYLALIDDIHVHHGTPSSGKGRISHAFLGTMAKRLLRKSVRPVLVEK